MLEELNIKKTNAQRSKVSQRVKSDIGDYKLNATGFKRESNHTQLERCRKTSCKS